MHKKMKKTSIFLIIINAVLLTLSALLFALTQSLSEGCAADSAKKAWDTDEMNFSQISIYYSESNSADLMTIISNRQSIKEKLKENSLKPEDGNYRKLFIDCASAIGETTLSGTLGSCNAAVTATYGDYFIFHPEQLMSGSYYSDEDINLDRVILDKQCSWQLFGAIDTAGMSVTIGDNIFYVAGVVDTPEDRYGKAAYGSTPRIYMPYDSISRAGIKAPIVSYELCIPDIVKDFAVTIAKEINTADEANSAVIEQTGRFGTVKLFEGFRKIPENAMITTSFRYPWTENRIRAAEAQARLYAGFMVIFLIIPAFSLVYALYKLTKLAGAGLRAAKEKAEQKYQEKISEEYFKNRK